MNYIKTVGELKAELAKYHDDLPICSTWEGIYPPVWGVSLESRQGVNTVVLDTDNY